MEKVRRFREVSPELRELARGLRREMTPAEQVLWDALRRGQVPGLRFGRQHPYRTYILDFCCPSEKLVIEVDGSIHDDPDVAEHDRLREEDLRVRGFRVLRFRNEEVFENLPAVLRRIADGVGRPPFPPAPFPPDSGARGSLAVSPSTGSAAGWDISLPLAPESGGKGAGGEGG